MNTSLLSHEHICIEALSAFVLAIILPLFSVLAGSVSLFRPSGIYDACILFQVVYITCPFIHFHGVGFG